MLREPGALASQHATKCGKRASEYRRCFHICCCLVRHRSLYRSEIFPAIHARRHQSDMRVHRLRHLSGPCTYRTSRLFLPLFCHTLSRCGRVHHRGRTSATISVKVCFSWRQPVPAGSRHRDNFSRNYRSRWIASGGQSFMQCGCSQWRHDVGT
jgi:hypothetical protein